MPAASGTDAVQGSSGNRLNGFLTSVPKERCVMAISSTMMLNSLALAVRLSRTCRNHACALRTQATDSFIMITGQALAYSTGAAHIWSLPCIPLSLPVPETCFENKVCLKFSQRQAGGELTARDTLSRCVRSCSALYCATTAFRISFPMEGSTRSSQSMPRLLKMWDSRWTSGFDSTLNEMFTICKSATATRECQWPVAIV